MLMQRVLRGDGELILNASNATVSLIPNLFEVHTIGTIEAIGLRTTYVHALADTRVAIANGRLAGQPVDKVSARQDFLPTEPATALLHPPAAGPAMGPRANGR